MNTKLSRRAFLRLSAGASAVSVKGLNDFAGTAGAVKALEPGNTDLTSEKVSRLFPAGLKGAQWNTFRAAGYSKPVTGICYRTKPAGYFGLYIERPFPVSGMPLGGIDTGALYLEPSGTLGYTSIFNHLAPIGGPLNTPYLGIATGGRAWVLGTGQTKNYAGNNRPSFGISVLGSMQESEYWGHHPRADVEYKSEAPVKVGVRNWSPFIPGDSKVSNTPGAVFELRGVWVEDKAWGMGYVVAALAENGVRTGGALGVDGRNWDKAEEKLPSTAEHDDGGSSLAVDYNLRPSEERVLRIILAWYAPDWEGNGVPGTGGGSRISTYAPEGEALSTTGKRFTHMYATRFADAGEVATFLARHHRQSLKRIIAWQVGSLRGSDAARMVSGLADQRSPLLRSLQHVGASQRSHWKLVQARGRALRLGRGAAPLSPHEHALQCGNAGANPIIFLPRSGAVPVARHSLNTAGERRCRSVDGATGRPC